MNTALNKFFDFVRNKEVAVIGIGISNQPLIEYLVTNGAKVTACDKRGREELGDIYTKLLKLNIQFNLGNEYLENLNQDIIFKTPGMRFDVPQLEKARERGAIVTSEMEIFFEVCPSHIIAVTGSDGKTTTTTIINKMLMTEGFKTWMGGNIGNPLLCYTEKMKKNDWVILELSSFQLQTMKKSPQIAVITNISPNHLDFHKDYNEYISAKKNIMLYQQKENILVVNDGNEITKKIGEDAKGILRCFSSKENALVHLKKDAIYYNDTEILKISDIKIPGMHNVENYMAAIATVYDMVSLKTIKNIAENFGGVEHRIELVRTLDGVRYYNSSIDSSPNRTINTLSVFPEKVIMIAGGKDKGIPYDELGPVLERSVKVLILIGSTAGKIFDALNKNAADMGIVSNVKVIFVKNYEEAVDTAKKYAVKNDVVLLSPASTSFDRFQNFEERGCMFKKLVNELE